MSIQSNDFKTRNEVTVIKNKIKLIKNKLHSELKRLKNGDWQPSQNVPTLTAVIVQLINDIENVSSIAATENYFNQKEIDLLMPYLLNKITLLDNLQEYNHYISVKMPIPELDNAFILLEDKINASMAQIEQPIAIEEQLHTHSSSLYSEDIYNANIYNTNNALTDNTNPALAETATQYIAENNEFSWNDPPSSEPDITEPLASAEQFTKSLALFSDDLLEKSKIHTEIVNVNTQLDATKALVTTIFSQIQTYQEETNARIDTLLHAIEIIQLNMNELIHMTPFQDEAMQHIRIQNDKLDNLSQQCFDIKSDIYFLTDEINHINENININCTNVKKDNSFAVDTPSDIHIINELVDNISTGVDYLKQASIINITRDNSASADIQLAPTANSAKQLNKNTRPDVEVELE